MKFVKMVLSHRPVVHSDCEIWAQSSPPHYDTIFDICRHQTQVYKPWIIDIFRWVCVSELFYCCKYKIVPDVFRSLAHCVQCFLLSFHPHSSLGIESILLFSINFFISSSREVNLSQLSFNMSDDEKGNVTWE